MSTALYVILEDRGVVSVDGPEAGPFLQGLISNDIERVTEARSIYAALLTPQGKFLHDFFVLRRGSGYLLDCEGPRTGDLGRRLMAYRLRADIALADATEDYRVVALFGDQDGGSALGVPAGEGGVARLEGGWVMRDPQRTRRSASARSCPARRTSRSWSRRVSLPAASPTTSATASPRARPTAAATWRWAGRR